MAEAGGREPGDGRGGAAVPETDPGLPAYAELYCASNFSFLRGASHPEELVARAHALGYAALVSRTELVLLVVGGVFVVEALSVILQVASFKLRGKRIFKCAPLHHHFQFGGMPETRVVVRTWVVSALLALCSLALFKVR